jgi:hypothetical protein
VLSAPELVIKGPARLTVLAKPCWLLGRDSGFTGSRVEETEARINRARLTNCRVDGVAEFRRVVAGSPNAGREFSDSIDRKIGQAREHRTQVVSNR